MAREMGKLRGKWNTKLEIATRDADNEQRLAREQQSRETFAQRVAPAINQPLTAADRIFEDLRYERYKTMLLPRASVPVSSAIEQVGASTFTWKELESRFRDIQAKTTGQRVSTNFIRTEWESGDVRKEWIVSGNLALGKEFELLASVAARKLGCTQSENVSDYWLDRVLEWIQQEGLDKDKHVASSASGQIVVDGASGTTGGMYTEKIAELSAMFCIELIARDSAESAVSQSSERLEVPQPTVIDRRRTNPTKKKLSKGEMRRQQVIFGAIQARLKGKKYFSELDSKRLPIPQEWKDRGCPHTYSDAYRDRYWRQRIQDQKTTYREKFDGTPAIEREAVIEGNHQHSPHSPLTSKK